MLTNFALHYVGGGPSDAVSADYFALWADAIQRMHDEKFVAILANGCCGDINNIDVNNRPVRKKARQILNDASEPLNRDQAYARELLLLSEMEPEIETEVQVIVINDLAIVALPGEMFVEIGLEIKRQSPFKYTYVIELANDYAGYVPTAKAFDEGGYETMFARSSKLIPEAAAQFTKSAVRLLGQF